MSRGEDLATQTDTGPDSQPELDSESGSDLEPARVQNRIVELDVAGTRAGCPLIEGGPMPEAFKIILSPEPHVVYIPLPGFQPERKTRPYVP